MRLQVFAVIDQLVEMPASRLIIPMRSYTTLRDVTVSWRVGVLPPAGSALSRAREKDRPACSS